MIQHTVSEINNCPTLILSHTVFKYTAFVGQTAVRYAGFTAAILQVG